MSRGNIFLLPLLILLCIFAFFLQADIGIFKSTLFFYCNSSLKREEKRNTKPSNMLLGDIFFYKGVKIDSKKLLKDYDFETEFMRYVTSVEAGCSNAQRLGKETDGGWDVCLSGPYQLKAPCLVYSFGIANDWSFDDAVSSQYKCTVRSFDPSIGLSNHTRTENGARVHFYDFGLDGNDTIMKIDNKISWTMRKFSTLYRDLDGKNGEPIVDYLKIDIEGAEINSIKAMYKDGMLNNIKQIGFEIHMERNIQRMRVYWDILHMLKKSGFIKWRFHINVHGGWKKFQQFWRPCCIELFYINSRFFNEHMDVTHVDHTPIDRIM